LIDTRTHRRVRAEGCTSIPALLLCFLAITGFATAQGSSGAVLTGVEIAPEGKLFRVTLVATMPLERFALSRQGPPENRDLVVKLKGVTSGLSVPPTDVSGREPAISWKVASGEEEGAPFVRVIFEREGDALVRLDHDAGKISLILIPAETKRAQATEASYRIGPDDVLAISVFGHDDLTKTSKVGPEGLVNFPLIGNVHAAGRTVDDVAAEIQERLAKDFLVDPHVTVSVWEYLSQWVNVIGEVAKPGRYYMTGPTSLIDAISQAGGLRPGAGESVLVTRRPLEANPADAGEILRFSAMSLFGDEKTSGNIRLRSGDVVNVLAREVIYVSGEIRSPGAYPLDRTTTLMKAITLAGGFASSANADVVDIIREDGGRQERIAINVREIENRKIQDPFLRPGDVIVVKRRS
jgi:polysaccharide export outer membrane protein